MFDKNLATIEGTGHARSKQKQTARSDPGNAMGRPGVDNSARMRNGTARPGVRVILRGVKLKGSGMAVDVPGYVSHVKGRLAYVETWGAIKRAIPVPVDALTFYGIAAR